MFFRRKLKQITYGQLVEDAKNNDITNWKILYKYSKRGDIVGNSKFNKICKNIIKTSNLPKYDSVYGCRNYYRINCNIAADTRYNINTGKVMEGTPMICVYEKNDFASLTIQDAIKWPFRLFE